MRIIEDQKRPSVACIEFESCFSLQFCKFTHQFTRYERRSTGWFVVLAKFVPVAVLKELESSDPLASFA